MKRFKDYISEKCNCDSVEEDADNTVLPKKKVIINPDGKDHLYKKHEKHLRPSIPTV